MSTVTSTSISTTDMSTVKLKNINSRVNGQQNSSQQVMSTTTSTSTARHGPEDKPHKSDTVLMSLPCAKKRKEAHHHKTPSTPFQPSVLFIFAIETLSLAQAASHLVHRTGLSGIRTRACLNPLQRGHVCLKNRMEYYFADELNPGWSWKAARFHAARVKQLF